MRTVIEKAPVVTGELEGLRAELHERPERAFSERLTNRYLEGFLEERGVEVVTASLGGTGILARVRGEEPGPTRLFRADLDAIPVSRPDGSTTNARHACGHDGHATLLAGALLALAREPGRLRGTVLGVFQPAEETGEGAQAVLQDSALADADVDEAFGIHNQPGLQLGVVGIAQGQAAAASTGLLVRVDGKSSHASTPHRGNTAIPALAGLAGELAALPSTTVPYGHAALATPTYLQAGPRQFGRVVGQGELGVTLRADTDECLDSVYRESCRRARLIAEAHDLEATIERVEPFPATTNHGAAAEKAGRVANRAGLSVMWRERPQPWSEDFGYFLRRWPGALLLLGAGQGYPSLHSEAYVFPDGLLEPGVRLWLALAGFFGE